jgi:hypothetical protein
VVCRPIEHGGCHFGIAEHLWPIFMDRPPTCHRTWISVATGQSEVAVTRNSASLR